MRGIIEGNSKVWLLVYANDIVLIANKQEELKAIMKRVEHFLDRRKLNSNVKKSTTLVFEKRGGKEKTRARNGKVKE